MQWSGMYSFLYTLLVTSGYNKLDCVITSLSTLIFENHRDTRMTAAEKTFREMISWNLRVIVLLEEDIKNETKRDVTRVHVIVLSRGEQKRIAYVLCSEDK